MKTRIETSVHATCRRATGETLLTLVVSALIMTFVMAAVVEMVQLNTTQGARTFNKVDAINDVRVALDNIGHVVRSARTVGELYADVPQPSQPIVNTALLGLGPSTNLFAVNAPTALWTAVTSGSAAISSNFFPVQGDPFYGSGTAPVGGWPASPWPDEPYTLSNQTLIVQVPVFDANGWPYALCSTAANVQILDTYVYQVLPDPNKPGTWMLQVAGFPAFNGQAGRPTNMQIGSSPVTLLKGIIGPLDANGNVKTFQYIDKTTNVASDSVVSSNIQDVVGVIVNLEVLKDDASAAQRAVLALRSEMYMRNNTMATLIGPPPSSN